MFVTCSHSGENILIHATHRLNMELDLQSLLGSMCTAVLIGFTSLWILIHLFTSMRIRIWLLLLINDLIKMMVSTTTDLQTLRGSIFSLYVSIVSVHSSPELHFESWKLLNFDYHADPDPVFTLVRFRIQLPKINNANPDPQPWFSMDNTQVLPWEQMQEQLHTQASSCRMQMKIVRGSLH